MLKMLKANQFRGKYRSVGVERPWNSFSCSRKGVEQLAAQLVRHRSTRKLKHRGNSADPLSGPLHKHIEQEKHTQTLHACHICLHYGVV